MKKIFTLCAFLCAAITAGNAGEIVLCDFENYNVGDAFTMVNIYGPTTSTAEVVADPLNPDNKVLHVKVDNWNTFVQFVLPEGITGKICSITIRKFLSTSIGRQIKLMIICRRPCFSDRPQMVLRLSIGTVIILSWAIKASGYPKVMILIVFIMSLQLFCWAFIVMSWSITSIMYAFRVYHRSRRHDSLDGFCF